MSFMNFDAKQAKHLRSPVRHLWPHIQLALTTMLQQAKVDLGGAGIEIALDLVDSPEFICGVVTGTSKGKISTGCLQMLWVCGYVNMMYWDRLYKAGGLTKSIPIDPLKDYKLKDAFDLFRWSLNVVFGESGETKWPAHLPRPLANADKGKFGFVATELTLEAVGFLILHEAAHIYLKHGPSEENHWSIEQEKDADRQAVEWFFQDLPDSKNGRRIKRGISVASALMMQCSVSLFSKKWGGASHPPTWQRLDQVIRQIESDEDHPIFAFLGKLVSLHRTMSGSEKNSKAFRSFLDGFDEFIDASSREHKAQLPPA